ncbi:hypothetical protein RIF29_24230 [Crotalaria pallida]|uniref:Uncharacterized protein n=1 Tax=Crotalaria pallida TaxID=3830 RepID=A0AAN9ERK3_CROPI
MLWRNLLESIFRYFPFYQISSRNGEFFGFTTLTRKNKPQFMVGTTPLMTTIMEPKLAVSFGVSEETIERMVNAQHEAMILSTSCVFAAANANETTNKNEEIALQSL